MAAITVARIGGRFLRGLCAFKGLGTGRYGPAVSAVRSVTQQQMRSFCAGHLSVQERIEKKRRAALVGGGQKRIDAQHQRVNLKF